jgi:hypothetical protein
MGKRRDPTSNTTRAKQNGGVAQEEEDLPSKHKVLTSNPSTAYIYIYIYICKRELKQIRKTLHMQEAHNQVGNPFSSSCFFSWEASSREHHGPAPGLVPLETFSFVSV